MYVLYLNLLFCMVLSFAKATFIIPNTKPSSCERTHYFQYSSLQCTTCGSSQQKSVDSTYCVCIDGAKLVSDQGGPNKVCQVCVAPKVVSDDGWNCVDCPQASDYVASTKTCKPCSTGQVSVARSATGNLLTNKQCVSCVGDTSPASSQRVCRRCHSGVLQVTSGISCVCPTGSGAILTGGVCLPSSSNIPADDSLSYLIRTQNFASAFYREYFPAAKVLCEVNQNYTACQMLGNLCVLLMYNEDNFGRAATDACKEYLNIVRGYKSGFVAGITDWPNAMPWLYYKANSPVEVLDKTNIGQSFTRGETMKYNLVAYAVNGTFVKIITDPTVLQLCPHTEAIAAHAFTLTTHYAIECKMTIAKLLQIETVFYDMYLVLNNNKNQYPIPVLVDNVQVRGESVNQGTDRVKWNLNRRFFLMDKYSGLRNLDDQFPVFMQYAQSIELTYRLRDDGLFYPPLLKVKYGAFKINKDTVQTDEVGLSFKVSYEMDTSKVDENIKIAVGVLSVLGVIYALVKIVSWRRREGLQMLDCTSCMLFIVYVCSALVLVFLSVLFVTCIQWLFFFKKQTTVIRVLPTESQENLIAGLLIAAFIMKIVDILFILYSQIYVDIFFVDWERPRGSLSVNMNPGGRSVATPVSIMRTLFVANEWREIQTIRRIKPTLQIVLVVLFLNGIGFEYWSTTDPLNRLSVSRDTDYVGDTNLCLRIAIVALLYFVIAVIQWIVFGFLYERFVGDSIGDFIDFCSMSNISVFIMCQKQFGHYIHGRSVHGRSDTSLHELYEQFQREEDNLCGKRGLEPNSDLQTFEMALTVKFRNEYSKIVQPLLTRDVQGARRGQVPMQQNRGLPGSHLTPVLDRSVKAYNSINRYLSSFVEHAIRDNDYMVKDKLLLEKLLRNELQPPLDKSIFYNDDGRSFTSILLYGQEWSLLIFNLLLFLIVDWASGWNSIVAGFVAYLVDILIVAVRDSVGKKNLASKTMVDERFLI